MPEYGPQQAAAIGWNLLASSESADTR